MRFGPPEATVTEVDDAAMRVSARTFGTGSRGGGYGAKKY